MSKESACLKTGLHSGIKRGNSHYRRLRRTQESIYSMWKENRYYQKVLLNESEAQLPYNIEDTIGTNKDWQIKSLILGIVEIGQLRKTLESLVRRQRKPLLANVHNFNEAAGAWRHTPAALQTQK